MRSRTLARPSPPPRAPRTPSPAWPSRSGTARRSSARCSRRARRSSRARPAAPTHGRGRPAVRAGGAGSRVTAGPRTRSGRPGRPAHRTARGGWSPTTRPARRETTTSASATGSGRCAITSTVRPSVSRETDSSTSDALSRSRCDVGSSRIRSGASLRKARASARRWRSPPLSRAPPSPIGVAYPSGRSVTNPWALAALAAATRSSSEASGRARRRFSATLPWNSDACCGTHATRVRQSAGSSSDSGSPPTVTLPRSGSTNRRRTFATVVLPAPVGPTSATVRPCGICERAPGEGRPRTVVVRHDDVVEPDIHPRRQRAAGGRRRDVDPHRRVEDRVDAFGGGRGRTPDVVLGGQAPERQEELGREQQHRERPLEREPAGHQPDAGLDRDERGGGGRAPLQDERRLERGAQDVHRARALPAAHGPDRRGLLRAAPEHLQGRQPPQARRGSGRSSRPARARGVRRGRGRDVRSGRAAARAPGRRSAGSPPTRGRARRRRSLPGPGRARRGCARGRSA